MQEGTLRKWFKGSKSKDGKGGWVNVVTGGTCASDKPGEGTPKCVSSAKRASMSKAERLSAQRRKKKADPGQQQKSGASKPTYVATDKKVKEDIELTDAYGNTFATIVDIIKPEPLKSNAPDIDSYETYDIEAMTESDKKGKGSGKKDACYHKVKSRYSVWPSAYASGALVKCRKKGAKNWGNSSKKEEFEGNISFSQFQEKAQQCWDTHKKVGMKMKGGKMVNDCRPKNEEVTNEAKKCWKGYEKKGTQKLFGKTYNRCVKKEGVQYESAWTKKSGKNPEGGLNEKGRKSYERENPRSNLKRPSKKVGNPRRKSFCARMKGMKKKLTSSKTARDPDSRINKSLRAWNC